jgi:hypothetical protein
VNTDSSRRGCGETPIEILRPTAGGSNGAIASIVGLIAGGLLYDWLGAWVFVLAALFILPISIVTARARLYYFFRWI